MGGRRDHVLLFVVRDARQARPRPCSLKTVAADFHAVDDLRGDTTPATRARIAEVLGAQPPSEPW